MAWERVPNVTWRTAQESLTLNSGWQKEHGDEQWERRLKNAV